MSAARKSLGGRPRIRKPKKGDKVQMSIRLPPDIRLKLQHATSRNGRSLSNEAEYRIERSFDRESLMLEVLTLRYGRPLAGLVSIIAETMQHSLETFGILGASSEALTPKTQDEDWLLDPYAFGQMMQAVSEVLAHLKPSGSDAPSAAMTEALHEAQRKSVAQIVSGGMVPLVSGRITGDSDDVRWANDVRAMIDKIIAAKQG